MSANNSAHPNDRRGFLRSLATLPLIGGGVTLLGQPTAAAIPITRGLLDAYDEFLDLERSFLKWERYGGEGWQQSSPTPIEAVFRDRHTGKLFDSRPVGCMTGFWHDKRPPVSSRAAVVLAAAGFGWRDREV